jgi:large subunit ribosomal protein L10
MFFANLLWEVKYMPSEKVLEQKKQQVAELVEKLQKATAGVLVDYRGLTVEEDTQLRAKLREANVEYKVVKNTLVRFAANEVGFEALDPVLNGPTSIAISYDDPVAAAKVLSDFAKTNDKLEIKAGFVDGKIISVEEIKNLAKLPSREMLIAQVLGGLNAPIAGLAGVSNGLLRGLVCALNEIAKKQAA